VASDGKLEVIDGCGIFKMAARILTGVSEEIAKK
jgi:hypothetical protein